MKVKLTKIAATIMGLLMTLALAVPAMAAQMETIQKGSKLNVKLASSAKMISRAVSNNSGIVAVDAAPVSGYYATLRGVETGNTTVTFYYSENGQEKNETVNIMVVDPANTQTDNISLDTGSNNKYTTRSFDSVGAPSSSNASVATITTTSATQVEITALKVGSATVSFTATLNGKTTYYMYNVTVTAAAVTAITENKVTLVAGQTTTLNARNANFTPSNTNTANIAKLERTSDNKVLVTGVAAGTTELKYTYVDWPSGSASGTTVTVTVPVEVTGSATSNTATENISLNVGDSKTVLSDMTSIGLTSSTSAGVADTKIAANGQSMEIIGRAPGTTTIIVTYTSSSGNGRKTFNVTVTAAAGDTSTGTANTASSGLYFAKNTATVAKGKKYRYTNISLNGKKITPASLLWISEDPTIVSVTRTTGIFQGKKKGKARIIAVDKAGKYVNSLLITIK